MEKSGILKDLEKEYSLEIKNGVVKVQNLIDLGITKNTLKAEAFLRNIYGDSQLVLEFATEEINEAKKSIEKIGERDILKNKNLVKEFEKIEKDEFNSLLDSLIISLN